MDLSKLERAVKRKPNDPGAIIPYVQALHQIGKTASPRYEAIASSDYNLSIKPNTASRILPANIKVKIKGLHWDGAEFAFAKLEGDDIFGEQKTRTYWAFRTNWTGNWGLDYRKNPYLYDSDCFSRLLLQPDGFETYYDEYRDKEKKRYLPIYNSDYYVVRGKDLFGNPVKVVINWWVINEKLWEKQTAFIHDFADEHNLNLSDSVLSNLMLSPSERMQYWMDAQKAIYGAQDDVSVSPNVLTINTLINSYNINPDLPFRFDDWSNYVQIKYSDFVLETIGEWACNDRFLERSQGEAYGFFDADNIDLLKNKWGVCYGGDKCWNDERWLGPFDTLEQARRWYNEMSTDPGNMYAGEGHNPAFLYQMSREIDNFENTLLEFQIRYHFALMEEGYWLFELESDGASSPLIEDLTFQPTLIFAQTTGITESDDFADEVMISEI